MSQHLWYVRKGDSVIGPFPAGQLQQLLRLGALDPDQKVSVDGQNWVRIGDTPLAPVDTATLRRETDDAAAWAAERDKARLRWLNDGVDGDGPRTVPREDEAATEALRRDEEATRALLARERSRKPRIVAGLLALMAISLLAVAVWYGQEDDGIRTSLVGKVSNCALGPAEGVSWAHCVKADANLRGAMLRNANLTAALFDGASLAGADLGYADLDDASLRAADLRGVRLIGASLMAADLTGADLRNADLSYAVLQGATLEAARLDGAMLSRATWVDGRVCGEGSVGACR